MLTCLHFLCNMMQNCKMTALIVFGPQKLPELAGNIGEARGEFKKTTGQAESIDV